MKWQESTMKDAFAFSVGKKITEDNPKLVRYGWQLVCFEDGTAVSCKFEKILLFRTDETGSDYEEITHWNIYR